MSGHGHGDGEGHEHGHGDGNEDVCGHTRTHRNRREVGKSVRGETATAHASAPELLLRTMCIADMFIAMRAQYVIVHISSRHQHMYRRRRAGSVVYTDAAQL